MGRHRQPARLKRWSNRPGSKAAWYLFWTDPSAGVERRLKCSALGATSADQRSELVKQYRQRERAEGGEVVRRGGVLAYDTSLFTPGLADRLDRHGDESPGCEGAGLRVGANATGLCDSCGAVVAPELGALDRYLVDVAEREATRAANPAGRGGLAAGSAAMLRFTVNLFTAWLEATKRVRITTSQLDGQLLSAFLNHLAKEPTRHGNRMVRRSAATLNKHRRNLRAAINWLADQRPPVFPDVTAFKRALKAVAGDAEPARAFAPADLQAFLGAALEREDSERVVLVERERSHVVIPSADQPLPARPERFFQSAPSTSVTPVSRLFLLLALTGCRLGEALGMRWADVDLDRGRLTIRAMKTGRTRFVSLTGAPEGTVAPGLAALLRRWRLEAGRREFVLPHGSLPAPLYPKAAWQAVNDLAGLSRLGPQHLRQNFVSYVASLGVPAAVAALWTGHSAAVAEKHYRSQVLDRVHDAESIEAAMGLASAIARLVAGEQKPVATVARTARGRRQQGA